MPEDEQKSVYEYKKMETKARFIEERIDDLFPDKNFYFYKIFEGNDEKSRDRNLFEQR